MNETYITLTALTPNGEKVSNLDKNNELFTTVMWQFKYSAHPRPQLNWYFRSKFAKFNKEIYRDMNKYKINENVDEKLITFTIIRPSDANVGEYKLVANNGFRQIEELFYYGSAGNCTR